MLSYLLTGMIFFSLVCAPLVGRTSELTQAALESAGKGVELTVSLLGMLCLWNGLMEVAKQSGVTERLAKLFFPITSRLFPGLPRQSAALNAVTLNLTANLLGLGNAATPFGLTAMRELALLSPGEAASNQMITFVVLNTASIQLIPTTCAVLRAAHQSAQPMEILPAVWITSIGALLGALLIAKLLSSSGRAAESGFRHKKRASGMR